MNKDFDEDALARVIRKAGGQDCPSPEHRDRLRRQALEAFDHAVALQQATPLPIRTSQLTAAFPNRREPGIFTSRAASIRHQVQSSCRRSLMYPEVHPAT